MSASISYPSVGVTAAAPLQFGVESAGGEHMLQWLLRRNCSITPRQMLAWYASLCVVSLGIAGLLWSQGATLVMPFAWIELVGVGIALLVYARHATDRESIQLRRDLLRVEHVSGGRVECVEFAPEWVRVEPEHGDRSLIELSGQGRRIAVGRFVRPEARRQLADELRWALRRWQWLAVPSDAVAPTQPAQQDPEESEN